MVAAPAVRAAVKTKLFCRNETIIVSFFAADKNKDNSRIYTRDGSYVWDELGQRTIARLITRLYTGKQTDHPS